MNRCCFCTPLVGFSQTAPSFLCLQKGGGGMPAKPDYSDVKTPVLLVTGAQDPLRAPGFGPKLQPEVPGARLHVFENAAHCPHIDEADAFNTIALDFLKQDATPTGGKG